jgi:hypothetical protein
MTDAAMTVDEIDEALEDDADHPVERAIAEVRERSLRARRGAQAITRAARSWPLVSEKEDWHATWEQAARDHDAGTFLMEQLGAETCLDPPLAATLLYLRQRLIDEWQIDGAAELMLLDLALLAYRNALRVQGWVENLALLVEAECFGLDPPRVRYGRPHTFADGLVVEEHLSRLREQVLPLLDRANRLFIRNLREIKQLRQPPAPFVAVGSAGQVNVGTR